MRTQIDPMLFINGWRFIQLVILGHLWITSESVTYSFTLLLFLLIMASLRWRFNLPTWTIWIDTLLCFFYFPYTDISLNFESPS